MRVHVCAVGRIRADQPERAIFEDYHMRFNRTGKPLALGPMVEVEVEDKKGGGMEAEAELLLRAVPAGALLVTLDERGRVMSSPEFAADLAKWRDGGRQDLAEATADRLAAAYSQRFRVRPA